MNDKFDAAKINLPDGREAYDCLKLAAIPTEGIFLKDHPDHLIVVQTQNTRYEFISEGGKVLGRAIKPDGSTPRYLPEQVPVNIHGSTWGGSMLKIGYIGVEMYLEFSTEGVPGTITTSAIVSVQVAALADCRLAA